MFKGRILNDKVSAVFQAYPKWAQQYFLTLRSLIFEVAAENPQIGEVEESLRWNEPAYLTIKSGSGSLIRMDWKSAQPTEFALYFHCKTTLIDDFRAQFGDQLVFQGSRAILFQRGDVLPQTLLASCFQRALTYHLQNGRSPTA